MNIDSITTSAQLARHFPIDPETVDPVIREYPMKISRYYLSLITSIDDPLGKQAVPDPRELDQSPLPDDPLHEARQSPLPCLIHRYPDRVVFLVSRQCAVNCRYCMRKRNSRLPPAARSDDIEKGLAYIRNHPEVRDVILSGGDPLMLTDDRLDRITRSIRRIKHVDVIRIHTRMPCVWPQRITPDLADILKRYHPVYLNTHFNHPAEITPQSEAACAILADAGIPLGCQTVLLKGVNDSASVMQTLMAALVRIRVRPYYLHHPDPVQGTGHFRPSVQTGLKILASLQGNLSGVCIPRYMIDLPGGGGKIPLQPDYIRQALPDRLIVWNYEGKPFEYPV